MSKSLKIFFIFSFSIIFVLFTLILNKPSSSTNNENAQQHVSTLIEKKQEIDYREYFVQPTYSDENIDLSNFNFNGKCRDPFKCRPNDEHDLIFTGIKYNDNKKWFSHKKLIKISTNLMKNTVPNARKICVVYDDDENLIKFINECGFDVIQINPMENKNVNPAIDRFLQLKKYLNHHGGEIKRVALIDFRDVFFFADGFQTISDEEVVFTRECTYYKVNKTICNDYTQKLNNAWMKKCYGEEIAEQYRKEKKAIHNVGMIIGGIKPFMQLLDVFLKEIERKKNEIHIWGMDNSMLNFLHHSGAFTGINLTVNTFSQRIAFTRRGGYEYDADKKSITNTIDGCSPIIRHKLEGNKMMQLI